jgi:hypothetical protein
MLGGRANRLDETASNRRFPWLWSWLDYQRLPGAGAGPPTVDLGRFIGGAVISAGSWLLASLWPAGLQLVPGSRIQAARPFPLRSVLAALNVVVSLIAATAAVPLALRRGRDLATDWLPAAAFLLLAAVYTVIIALGRSLERGIIPTLLANGSTPTSSPCCVCSHFFVWCSCLRKRRAMFPGSGASACCWSPWRRLPCRAAPGFSRFMRT